MAEIARNGNKAEARIVENREVRAALATHLGTPISQVALIPGKKKSDIRLDLQDTRVARLQNKNGTGGGRGWSVDRRAVNNLPLDEAGKQLLSNVCLKKGTERPEVCQPKDLLKTLLLGSDEAHAPTHYTHSVVDKTTGEIKELHICTAAAMLEALTKELYPNLVAKKTCVHLSPRLYLQRKGGGSKDSAPDDIQLKLKSMPDIMTRLILETTPVAEVQMP
jgi:hypothetical protein